MANRRPGDPPRLMQICDTFGNFFILNLLFTICSLPIFTIGASINALNSMMLKILQDKDGKIVKGFFDEFKKGFFKSTCIWFVYIISALIIYSEFLVLKQGTEKIRTIMLTLIIIEAIFVLTTLPFVFWMNARYENTVKMMFINSFILFFKRFWTWLRMVITWAGPISLMAFFYTILVKFWFIWFVILISFLTYVCGMVMMKEFALIEKKDDTSDDNEANGERKTNINSETNMNSVDNNK